MHLAKAAQYKDAAKLKAGPKLVTEVVKITKPSPDGEMELVNTRGILHCSQNLPNFVNQLDQ